MSNQNPMRFTTNEAQVVKVVDGEAVAKNDYEFSVAAGIAQCSCCEDVYPAIAFTLGNAENNLTMMLASEDAKNVADMLRAFANRLEA